MIKPLSSRTLNKLEVSRPGWHGAGGWGHRAGLSPWWPTGPKARDEHFHPLPHGPNGLPSSSPAFRWKASMVRKVGEQDSAPIPVGLESSPGTFTKQVCLHCNFEFRPYIWQWGGEISISQGMASHILARCGGTSVPRCAGQMAVSPHNHASDQGNSHAPASSPQQFPAEPVNPGGPCLTKSRLGLNQ